MEDKSLEGLAAELKKFAGERDWDQFHSPKNLSMALAIETAELMEHFQWLTEEQSSALSPEKLQQVREEIGDVLIYLTRLADRLGIDLLEAATEKLAVNQAKYPAGKVRGSAKKYTEL
jgi:dCTP diphosphatase